MRQNTMKSLIAKTGMQLMVGGASNVIDLPLWEFHLVEGGAKVQPRAAAEHDRKALGVETGDLVARIELIERGGIRFLSLIHI